MAEQFSMIAASEGAADVAGIAALLIRFSDAVDHRRPADVAEQFSLDGLFRPGEQDIRGRSAIQAFYTARLSDERRRTRHLWSNLFVRPIDPKQVRIEVVLTNYAFEPAVCAVALQMRIGNVAGRCESDEAGNWRFAEHLYARVFATSLPLAGGTAEAPRS
jgi:nuclear transport factor 2 (NTF2) superfamily protein